MRAGLIAPFVRRTPVVPVAEPAAGPRARRIGAQRDPSTRPVNIDALLTTRTIVDVDVGISTAAFRFVRSQTETNRAPHRAAMTEEDIVFRRARRQRISRWSRKTHRS